MFSGTFTGFREFLGMAVAKGPRLLGSGQGSNTDLASAIAIFTGCYHWKDLTAWRIRVDSVPAAMKLYPLACSITIEEGLG